MNAHSIYYLWNNQSTKKYLEDIIAQVVTKRRDYQLLDTFNDQNGNLKSYVFFESDDLIVHFDFNKSEINKDLINFIKLSSQKRVITIVFNTADGSNKAKGEVYYINKNKTNSNEVKLLLTTDIKEQHEFDCYGVVDYLYNLDDTFYQKYLNELNKVELFQKI